LHKKGSICREFSTIVEDRGQLTDKLDSRYWMLVSRISNWFIGSLFIVRGSLLSVRNFSFLRRGKNNVPLYIGPICAKVSNVTWFSEEVKFVSAYGQRNKKNFNFFPILLANAPNLVDFLRLSPRIKTNLH